MAVLILTTLSSCSKSPSPEEELQEIQDEFLSVDSISVIASITADYGQRVYNFRLNYESDGENGLITVLEPESIAGAAVEIVDSASTLTFQGARVYTGEILPDGLSPVDSLPAMVSACRQGLATQVFREDWENTACLCAVFIISEDVELRVWFDEAARLPLHSEFSFQGYTVITCDFDNISAQ